MRVGEGCFCGEVRGIPGWFFVTLRAFTQNDREMRLLLASVEGLAKTRESGNDGLISIFLSIPACHPCEDFMNGGKSGPYDVYIEGRELTSAGNQG